MLRRIGNEEAVNTVCLGLSLLSSVSHGFIDGFWRRLRIWVAKTKDYTHEEAVNTVCLGFSDEFIEFSQSWFYGWFLAKITDFRGKDEGFLAKITDFWRRLQIFRRRLQIFQQRSWISLFLPMFTVHTNE